MKTVGATEAKNGFGRMLDAVQREPVTIQKKGRPVAVVLSHEEYGRLEALDDAWWAKRAELAGRVGFAGPEESEAILEEMLNAED
ncbi:MAG: type II toxin-antitoxin system Phd/YefM family antitoxin [bacterium]